MVGCTKTKMHGFSTLLNNAYSFKAFNKGQNFAFSLEAYLGGGPLCHGPLWVARIAKLHREVSKIEICPPLCKFGIKV